MALRGQLRAKERMIHEMELAGGVLRWGARPAAAALHTLPAGAPHNRRGCADLPMHARAHAPSCRRIARTACGGTPQLMWLCCPACAWTSGWGRRGTLMGHPRWCTFQAPPTMLALHE